MKCIDNCTKDNEYYYLIPLKNECIDNCKNDENCPYLNTF